MVKDMKGPLTDKLSDTPYETIDKYLMELKANQHRWAQDISVAHRIALLVETLENIERYKDEWIACDLLARHIPPKHWDQSASGTAGPGVSARVTRVYIEILKEIEKNGGNKPFAKSRQDGDRVIVEAFPRHFKEHLILPGFRGEIHLEKGTKVEELASLQATAYKNKSHKGGISLVLGAGNVSSLTVNALYTKLFMDKEVVIIKANPVLNYMGPLFEKILQPFIREGFVRIINGDIKEGAYVANHPLVDDIHITGSKKSFENIVYGSGEEGIKNKAVDYRVNIRPVTGELGNVTPVIVVPGDWKESDFDYQADNILSMLSPFNGYTCTAMRVLILPKFWDGSIKLIKKLEEKLSQAIPAVNYYPGTNEIINNFLTYYSQAIKFGTLNAANQPWILVENLDPNADEKAFSHEFWAAITSQTSIDGSNGEEYLINAVRFANEKLWGTLSAVLVIESNTEKKMKSNGSLDKAIDELRYGTVTLNIYPGLTFIMGSLPWGGYPGATYTNIQSGNGFVSNPFMLDKIEKTVCFAPFRMNPKPSWFIEKNPNFNAAKAYANYCISNKLIDFFKVIFATIKHKGK